MNAGNSCHDLDSLLARLEAAERERDHWIVETKKADRRLEAAERVSAEWETNFANAIERLRAAEQESERLRAMREAMEDQFTTALDSHIARLEALNSENASLNAENRDLLEKWSERGARLEAAERERDTALEAMKQWNLYAKEYAARAEAAEAENERLREALERLASDKTRLRIDQGQGIGKFARAALAENERLREALEAISVSDFEGQRGWEHDLALAALAARTEEPRSHPRSAEITHAYRERLDTRTEEQA